MAHRLRVRSLYREILRRVKLLSPQEYEIEPLYVEVQTAFRENKGLEPSPSALAEAEDQIGLLRTITPRFVKSRQGKKKPYADLKVEPAQEQPEFTTVDNKYRPPPKLPDYYFVNSGDR
jgi:hypothetical protein